MGDLLGYKLGPFVIRRELGNGTGGKVYLAQDTRTNAFRAIKQARVAGHREARLKQIRNPNTKHT